MLLIFLLLSRIFSETTRILLVLNPPFVNLLDTLVNTDIIKESKEDKRSDKNGWGFLKRLLENDQLVVGISELSDIVGVSPRQLRYWEQRDSFVQSKLMRIV